MATDLTTQFEYPVAEWWTGEYSVIPENLKDGIENYLIHRLKPGGFLSAVIRNDLFGAVGRADTESLNCLLLIVRWFYNRAPSVSHGSSSAMSRWLNRVENESVVEKLEFAASTSTMTDNVVSVSLLSEAIAEIVRLQQIVDSRQHLAHESRVSPA